MSSTSFINPRSNSELRSLNEIILLPQQNHLQDYFLGVMAILSEYFSIKYSALCLQDPQKDSLYPVRNNAPLLPPGPEALWAGGCSGVRF